MSITCCNYFVSSYLFSMYWQKSTYVPSMAHLQQSAVHCICWVVFCSCQLSGNVTDNLSTLGQTSYHVKGGHSQSHACIPDLSPGGQRWYQRCRGPKGGRAERGKRRASRCRAQSTNVPKEKFKGSDKNRINESKMKAQIPKWSAEEEYILS